MQGILISELQPIGRLVRGASSSAIFPFFQEVFGLWVSLMSDWEVWEPCLGHLEPYLGRIEGLPAAHQSRPASLK